MLVLSCSVLCSVTLYKLSGINFICSLLHYVVLFVCDVSETVLSETQPACIQLSSVQVADSLPKLGSCASNIDIHNQTESVMYRVCQ